MYMLCGLVIYCSSLTVCNNTLRFHSQVLIAGTRTHIYPSPLFFLSLSTRSSGTHSHHSPVAGIPAVDIPVAGVLAVDIPVADIPADNLGIAVVAVVAVEDNFQPGTVVEVVIAGDTTGAEEHTAGLVYILDAVKQEDEEVFVRVPQHPHLHSAAQDSPR